MEIFLDSVQTKNKKEILLCGICEDNRQALCIERFRAGMKQVHFTDTTDEFFLDYSLMKELTAFAADAVLALGASIFQKGVLQRSGAIIGNPFDETHSNDDTIEEIHRGLFCVGFPGRVGFVFQGSGEDALEIKETLEKQLGHVNEEIVPLLLHQLNQKTDFYIVASDGSGEGGYPYVCGKNKNEFYEKRLTP